MIKNAGGHWMGISSVGIEVVENMPDSLTWKVQLWKLDDCVNYCEAEIKKYGYSKSFIDIKHIEPIMIQKLSPKMNMTYNGSFTSTTNDAVEPKRFSKEETTELLRSFGFSVIPTTDDED